MLSTNPDDQIIFYGVKYEESTGLSIVEFLAVPIESGDVYYELTDINGQRYVIKKDLMAYDGYILGTSEYQAIQRFIEKERKVTQQYYDLMHSHIAIMELAKHKWEQLNKPGEVNEN